MKGLKPKTMSPPTGLSIALHSLCMHNVLQIWIRISRADLRAWRQMTLNALPARMPEENKHCSDGVCNDKHTSHHDTRSTDKFHREENKTFTSGKSAIQSELRQNPIWHPSKYWITLCIGGMEAASDQIGTENRSGHGAFPSNKVTWANITGHVWILIWTSYDMDIDVM